MPATSVFLRHVLPPANTLQIQITPYIKKFGASLPLIQSQASQKDSSHRRRADDVNGHYQNLRDGAVTVTSKEEYKLGYIPQRG